MSQGNGRRQPELSVVVVVYNMAREAPRTLHSLSASYQRHIAADEYEVIVVDNGSEPAFDAKVLDGLTGNFRLIRMDSPSPSPAKAINAGLAAATGDVIGVMIDGARIATPGLLHYSRKGAQLYPRSVVANLGWHLGFDLQRWAIQAGYNAAREDALLASIGWPKDGYRLFEIAALDGSSINGWFRPIAESNALFLRRETWDELAGVDEQFDAPGGGFLNLDTFRRALELTGSELVILLGEGTFHQIHGGSASNTEFEAFSATIAGWRNQYESIRGYRWHPLTLSNRTYLGVLPKPALAHFMRTADRPMGYGLRRRALDATSDTGQSPGTAAPPRDSTVAALTELARAEFRAGRFEAAATVARLARARAPDDAGPQHLLAHAGAWLTGTSPPDKRAAEFHLARANAYRLLDDATAAESEYRSALTSDPDLVEAYIGLAELRMPGPRYMRWLTLLHAALLPATYLEIGVADGLSLARARPPTCAIGVDPVPTINAHFKAETHIFCETSDEFFERQRLAPLLNGRPLALAFIDGLHTFQQALKDFMHVEAFCGPQSVVLLHDTIPFDERTQKPQRELKFYTGDIWKAVICLKHYRPDLDIFNIATPWSGLTVVTGLDPASRILPDNYDEAVARFIGMPYSEFENAKQTTFDIVPNKWKVVEARLKARGIFCHPP